MTARYIITKVDICPECTGAGVLSHPDWVKYWTDNPLGAQNTDAEDEEYFRGLGYTIYSTADFPPEEIPCGECEGAGETSEIIDLRQALLELGTLQLCDNEACQQPAETIGINNKPVCFECAERLAA